MKLREVLQDESGVKYRHNSWSNHDYYIFFYNGYWVDKNKGLYKLSLSDLEGWEKYADFLNREKFDDKLRKLQNDIRKTALELYSSNSKNKSKNTKDKTKSLLLKLEKFLIKELT